MIIDAFTYAGEQQTLKMRLELHSGFVDQFWISEADYTFSGNFKGWLLEDIKNQLFPWKDKIRYIKFSAPIDGLDFSKKDEAFNFSSPAWSIESAQRNALSECLKEASANDIAIISDIDELVNPETIVKLKDANFDICRLEMENHYYYMNCKAIGQNRSWCLPIAAKAGWWRENSDVSFFRPFGDIKDIIRGAGWHFSYLGGVEAIRKKISSFSHTELDRPEINNFNKISRSIYNGEDYIGREGHEFAFYPVGSYPGVIQALMHKNRNFVRWSLY